ncbi:MAG: hypothetical protein IPP04_17285 [Saprospiraceae bacterium]|nr:hypothetical protein [Saprospiraceae bacterium]
MIGGIIGALVFGAIKYWDYLKVKKPMLLLRRCCFTPINWCLTFTVVSDISGILGAKIFALFEGEQTWSSFMLDPVKAFSPVVD